MARGMDTIFNICTTKYQEPVWIYVGYNGDVRIAAGRKEKYGDWRTMIFTSSALVSVCCEFCFMSKIKIYHELIEQNE